MEIYSEIRWFIDNGNVGLTINIGDFIHVESELLDGDFRVFDIGVDWIRLESEDGLYYTLHKDDVIYKIESVD